jgi:hypothetical protein
MEVGRLLQCPSGRWVLFYLDYEQLSDLKEASGASMPEWALGSFLRGNICFTMFAF